MFKLLCVTNRHLCRGDFLKRVEALAAAGAWGILLREKDLSPEDYRTLARQVQGICQKYGTMCVLHNFASVALELQAEAFHAPLAVLRQIGEAERRAFPTLGASCHSVEDAREAQALGCTYLTAGHIFDTDSKKGLPGRGLDFLRAVCTCVDIPAYAIGGIGEENLAAVRQAGAAGACLMSGPMTWADVETHWKRLQKAGEYHV